jgi:hypothetical protein
VAASEIEWNIAICASTYAELGEAWASLRAVCSKLNNPDGGSVLSQAEAGKDFEQAVTSVTKTLQGLDSFLNIQGAYLERIRADYIPVQVIRTLVGPQTITLDAETPDKATALLEAEQEGDFQTENEGVNGNDQAEALVVPGFAAGLSQNTGDKALAENIGRPLTGFGPAAQAALWQAPLVMPLYQPQPGWLAEWNHHVNYGSGDDLNQMMPLPSPWTLAIRYQPG